MSINWWMDKENGYLCTMGFRSIREGNTEGKKRETINNSKNVGEIYKGIYCFAHIVVQSPHSLPTTPTPQEVIDYLTKTPVQDREYFRSSCWEEGPKRHPRQYKIFSLFLVDCQSMKARSDCWRHSLHTLVIAIGEVRLVLIPKLPPRGLAPIVLEGNMEGDKG